MSQNEREIQTNTSAETRPNQKGHMIWNAAIVVALLANLGLFISNRQIAASVARADQHSQEQFARLNEDMAQNSASTSQSVEALAQKSQEAAAQAAAEAEAHARQELRRTSATLNSALTKQQQAHEEAQQQVVGQLSQLQEANTSAAAKIEGISGDVNGIKTNVASTQEELKSTGADLKRVMGDMGVMSGLIATNSTQLGALRELGDRDYIEFHLNKKAQKQKVGDLQLTLAKADPKHNRFTLRVMADDKMVEKRDRTINEPVQLYVSGNRLPQEIVVNEVGKDEIAGYIAVPKVRVARR